MVSQNLNDTTSSSPSPQGDGDEVGVSFDRSSFSFEISLSNGYCTATTSLVVLKDDKLFEKLILVGDAIVDIV